ncbi:MAG: D-alanyl-D-alanine carboxypeptidase family protein [Bacillota bacterium]|nr:D-alanyl-D-alanine carboxypeptidase family protein [Bacillota bacterium]
MNIVKLKVIPVLLCISMLFFNFFYINVSAGEINVDAKCAVALDSKTKAVLYEKNSQMIVPMASTTKIITALVAINYGNLDKKVEISEKAANIKGSTVGYKKGEMISIRELVFGLMLRSGNDAAIAISEGIAGSTEEFVKLMNEYAHIIGICSTHFESPHGLDSDYHYSTAYDLALATAKAKELPLFNEIVSTKDIEAEKYGFSRSYHNINKILWQLDDADGVKTGSTGKAGKCLVTSVNIDDNSIIIVVLNSNGRWKETKKIHDYVVKNYEYKKVISKDTLVAEMPIGDSKNKIKLSCNEDIIIPVRKNAAINIKTVFPSSDIKLPIKKGDKIGSLYIYDGDNKLLFTHYLEAKNGVADKNKIKVPFFKFNKN